jgi:hypothetical protein
MEAVGHRCPFATVRFASRLVSAVRTLSHSLFTPVDISFLAFVRIVYGLTMLWHTWSVISGGRIKLLYIDPVFHFTWYGFEWVRPWLA